MRIRRILCLSAWHPTPGTVKPRKREFTPSWLVGMGTFAEHCRGGLEAWKAAAVEQAGPLCCPLVPNGAMAPRWWSLGAAGPCPPPQGSRLPLHGLQEGDVLGDEEATPATQLPQAGCLPGWGWESFSPPAS